MTDGTDVVSKRAFLAGISCRTRGWHAQHAVPVPPTPALEWRFHVGNEVGRIARQQLGPGLLLSRSPTASAVEATTRALDDPASGTLFEATFRTGQLVARADALRRASGGWDLIEVKSAKEPADGLVDDEHLDDLAFTTLVARTAGLPINRCVLAFIARDYRLGSAAPFLVECDVTAAATARADAFAAVAADVVAACLAPAKPAPQFDLVCRKCDYFETDWGMPVAESVFVLPGLSAKRLRSFGGIIAVRHLPDEVDLTDNQRRVFDVIRSGVPAKDTAAFARFVEIVWPAYYLDFETVDPVPPWFDGTAAYDTTPFQYSIHVCDRPGHVAYHREYLAPNTGDWRRRLAEQLLDDLGTEGSIIVYTSFEQERLTRLGELFPDLAELFRGVIARLFDLHEVVKAGYCHPAFKGRTSIKVVLPVIAPELRYDTMAVGDGGDASALFALMRVGKRDPASHEQLRRDLLEYCKLDTEAMVRVHAGLAALP